MVGGGFATCASFLLGVVEVTTAWGSHLASSFVVSMSPFVLLLCPTNQPE